MEEYSGIMTWLSSPIWLVGMYLYFAVCMYVIAKKIGHKSPWWAFVPILNLYQTVELAGKKWYWFVFYLVPIVNIVTTVMIWMEIARARYKWPGWGIFMLLPVINFIIPLFLAIGPGQPSPNTPYGRENVYQHTEKVGS